MNEQVILGTLLGDAWIQKYNNRKSSYSFSFSQSIKDYAVWKAEQSKIPYSIYERDRFDRRTGKTYYSCQIILKMDRKDKTYYYNLFYTPKKEVSQKILDQLGDEAIAVWYLDDGNMYYNGNNCHITLAVNGFNIESKERIITWFKSKYNLNFKHSCKAIRITSKKECEMFMNIVESHIPECMNYKKLSSTLAKYHNNLTIDRQNRRWKINR